MAARAYAREPAWRLNAMWEETSTEPFLLSTAHQKPETRTQKPDNFWLLVF